MGGDFPNLSAETMAQWPSPNTTDPITRGWLPPYAISLAALSTVAVFARLWSQLRKTADGLRLDDWLAFVAWIFAISFTVVCMTGIFAYGFDRHMWDVPSEYHSRAALTQWLSEGAFILSACLTKISILCFFRRLDPPCPSGLRRLIYFFIALTVGSSVACLLAQILVCRPTSDYWRIPTLLEDRERSCESQQIYYPFQGSLDCISTLYSIVIPILVLRNLPMSENQRRGLRAVCVLGLVVLAAAITRTIFLSILASSSNGDATWNSFNVFVYAQIECHLSLICASVPFLHRYFLQYPRVPIVYSAPQGKNRSDSVVSRVSSSLSGQIKRSLHLGRKQTQQQAEISRPQAVEIPEWEFQALESPRAARFPVNGEEYDRYVAGRYGPPAPPKDSRTLFEQYRREHGEMV
ncbi:hypothetical protein P154DRAFT_619451 [Amniculicola lignicola CBS 123094]|uniref:Rhodopsin domain-containing protein n=1 Tax=Amniculicola lignicola CBS 123094 TaxID=1392246 RepID=A0A6A5WMN6_9PLEO|nr:hypothetical protein P154DRAFT_619451 [Amniculicola lignicola CBS 123094]